MSTGWLGQVGVADVEQLGRAGHALIDEQYSVFNDQLMPALAKEGIAILNHAQRNEAQRRWVARGAYVTVTGKGAGQTPFDSVSRASITSSSSSARADVGAANSARPRVSCTRATRRARSK